MYFSRLRVTIHLLNLDLLVDVFLLYIQGTPEGLLMRFTSPVTYLTVSSDHTLLAAGTSEFTVKVIETADSVMSFTLTGHEAPILSVAFDPRGEYIASSSCDGSVKIWSVKTKVSSTSNNLAVTIYQETNVSLITCTLLGSKTSPTKISLYGITYFMRVYIASVYLLPCTHCCC